MGNLFLRHLSRLSKEGLAAMAAAFLCLAIVSYNLLHNDSIILGILSLFPLIACPYFIYRHLKMEFEKEFSQTELSISKNLITKLMAEEEGLYKAMKKQIDRHKKDKEEIKLKESQSKMVLDTVVESVIQIDERGIIKIFNPASERIFGYKHEEVLGKSLNILLPNKHKKKHDKYLKNYKQTGNSTIIGKERLIMARHKSGKTFPIEIEINEAQNTTGREFVAIIRDITEQKRAEKKLRKYTDKLEWANYQTQKAMMDAERANHAKSLFLANMSHEIRTPLNGIMGMTELMLNTELSDKQKRYSQQIYESGTTLLEIINDILDFSKIEANAMKMEKIPFNLNELINNCKNMFQPLFDEKSISLNINYPKNIADDYIGDPVRVRQIITNLIGNALKFTEKGSVTLTITKKRGMKEKEVLLFEVKDTGIGIARNHLKNIFDKFAQADISTTRKFGGTGLGLAICKQLVDLMKGHIGVKSKIGGGSLFWFQLTLPINNETTKQNNGDKK